MHPWTARNCSCGSTCPNVISFNGEGQLCQLTSAGWRDLQIFTRMSAIKSRRQKKAKNQVMMASAVENTSWKRHFRDSKFQNIPTIMDKIDGKFVPPLPPPLPPLINDGKMVHFGFCTASSLNWRWGVAVPFYSVQDCRCLSLLHSRF